MLLFVISVETKPGCAIEICKFILQMFFRADTLLMGTIPTHVTEFVLARVQRIIFAFVNVSSFEMFSCHQEQW